MTRRTGPKQPQVFHAVSVSYFINAALNGMFFHGLLLSTGNIFVPIVAHAVHNAFALVNCHLKVRFSPFWLKAYFRIIC